MKKDGYGFPDITIKGELLEDVPSLVHRAFKSRLSQASRQVFENAEAFADAAFTLDLALVGLALANDMINILRKGAINPALRDIDRTHLAKATDPLVRGLSRLLDPIVISIIPIELAKRHLGRQRLEQISAAGVSPVELITRLTAGERQSCINDLALEKIGDLRIEGENLVDGTALIWLKALHTLICRQAVVVAFPQGPYIDRSEWMEAVERLEKMFREICSPPGAGEDQEMTRGDQERGEPGPVRGALPGLLVLPPIAWSKFTANWAEHFGSSDPLDAKLQGPSPEDWHWLLDDAHYLIAFPASAPITGADSTVQHYLRRLVALSRCCRSSEDWSIDLEQSGSEFVLSHVSPARCRVITVPLEIPERFISSDFSPTDKQRAELFVPQRGELRLAGRPFISCEEFSQGWMRQLDESWDWLSTELTPRADLLRHVLDCYEIACTLGVYDDMPALQREGWQLVALMGTAEAVLETGGAASKRSALGDNARSALRRAGERGDVVEKTCAAIQRGYDLRNDFVHGGRCYWNSGDIAGIRRSIGLVVKMVILAKAKGVA